MKPPSPTRLFFWKLGTCIATKARSGYWVWAWFDQDYWLNAFREGALEIDDS